MKQLKSKNAFPPLLDYCHHHDTMELVLKVLHQDIWKTSTSRWLRIIHRRSTVFIGTISSVEPCDKKVKGWNDPTLHMNWKILSGTSTSMEESSRYKRMKNIIHINNSPHSISHFKSPLKLPNYTIWISFGNVMPTTAPTYMLYCIYLSLMSMHYQFAMHPEIKQININTCTKLAGRPDHVGEI